MISSNIKNTTGNMIGGYLNRLVTIALTFVSRTMLIYLLGAEYLGLDSLFASVLQMLNIAELGFSSAVVFNMYKPIADHDTDRICALLKLYRKTYRVIGAVILVVGLALTPLLPYIIKEDIPADLNLYLLYFIFLGNTVAGYWLFAYKKSLFSAHQQERINSNINTAMILAKVGAQFIIILLFHNYYLYIILMPIATLLENISVSLLTDKLYPEYVCRGDLERSTLRDIITQIKGLMIQKICQTSRNSMDNIIVSAYIGLTMVTIYGNYYSIMYAARTLTYCAAKSMSASVGNQIVKSTPEKNHQDMLTFNFLYMWLSGIVAICMLTLYQPFMSIWVGEKLMLPDHISVMFCIYYYALCSIDILSVYATGVGLWWEGRYQSIAEAVSNIILNILLGKFFGVFGIVLATILSIVVIDLIYGTTIIYKNYFTDCKIRIFYLEHMKYAAATLLTAVIVSFICQKIPNGGIGNLILKAVYTVLLTNVCLLLFYCKSKTFKNALRFVKHILK